MDGNLLFAAQDDIGGEQTVSIMEPAVSAVFFGGMAHGLQAHAFARTLGREEGSVFYPDLFVIGIFHGQ